jgi:hypothetical protein
MGTITIGLDEQDLTYSYNGETFPLRHYHYDVFEFHEPFNGIRFASIFEPA